MGISPALWDDMRTPKAGGGGELSLHTQTYLDVYIALECFHMRYPDYIKQTTQSERELYAYYLGLKAAKEEYAMQQTQRDHDRAQSPQSGFRA